MNQKQIFTITGGLGFIGKHFVKRLLKEGHFVTNIDIINYAADRVAQKEFETYENYRLLHKDICKLDYLPETDFIVNFAAESHVDNSIANSRQFCESNFLGTQRLLELTRAKAPDDRPRFIQISTDEVYGDIVSGMHSEDDILKPSNPYSATKAAADMLLLGWGRTYGLTYNIVRMTNNYGPHQFPEKLIPKSIGRLMRGKPALLHGEGQYYRNWLHVEDSVDGILTIIDKGAENTIYNVNGNQELQNIEVVRKIAHLLNIPEERAYKFVGDRVGQDIRYSLDSSRIHDLGWQPTRNFDDELKNIIEANNLSRFL